VVALGHVVFSNQNRHPGDDSSKDSPAGMWFATVALAASPPDVRKAYGLPAEQRKFWGYAPRMIKKRGGARNKRPISGRS
ncbi:MAG: hypothetical protein ABR556_14035, partial [Pyrinomonadaceae bacterium]